MSNSGFSWGAKLSDIADAVWTRTTRELTQAKFPFWSAIITQTQGSISVPASSSAFVNIIPSPGEAWWVEIACVCLFDSSGDYVRYFDYDGTTARLHIEDAELGGYKDNYQRLVLTRYLTNTLYARLEMYNASSSVQTGYYGYSGFKMSNPQWSAKKTESAILNVPFKRPVKDVAIPQLAAKAYLNPENKIAYHLATEVLAVDPDKNVPVETVEYHVLEEDLVQKLTEFKANPEKTGWKKIFDKLVQEGTVL